MANSFFKFVRNMLFALLGVLLIGALGGAGWYYYGSQLPEPAVPSQKPSPSERPRAMAVLRLDTSRQPAPAESPLLVQPVDTRPGLTISIRPLERFEKDVRAALVKELAAAYPQLGDLNPETNGADRQYRNSAFQFSRRR